MNTDGHTDITPSVKPIASSLLAVCVRQCFRRQVVLCGHVVCELSILQLQQQQQQQLRVSLLVSLGMDQARCCAPL